MLDLMRRKRSDQVTVLGSELILEPAAQQLADATAGPPFLSEMGYAAARKLLDDIQAGPVQKLPVDEEWVTVPAERGAE
jgi:acetyl esterase